MINTEKLKGGLADNKTLEDICEKHRCNLEQLTQEYKLGLQVETEHTEDKSIAKEIALDHLWEKPNYYSKLKKVEEGTLKLVDIMINESLFKIEPKMAFAIYNVLKKEFPDIAKKHTESSFFYLLNDKL